jgi:tRNA A-37 threonylcarbamoyl transferase component Bud32/tetratricopeptide (TPR) repeat protein
LKLARYEVVRELGKGAMGIVYLAKDPLIGRLVALKTIRPAQHADDDETKEFQQRFLREAQAAGILNHASIVTVHDIGQDETTGVMFIAMEYVEGYNLKEALTQGRPLNFEQIGEIIAQVADALDFAHAKGIVHRDVKPANVILLDGLRAKITDFGIAKIASGQSNLTSTGQFLGTPNYMAPEQIKGAPVDGRTDIFALGICLYECLTRRKPFGGDSLTSISYKIVHEPFPPLSEINPQIPEGYEDVIAKCLAKDPAKRYQRARDLALHLRAVIRGERPVHTEPLLAEETIITRDRERTPTIEIPFPDADTSDPGAPLGTNPAGTVAAAAAAAAKAAPAARKPAGPRQPVAETLKKTLTNVRAMPLWRRTVPYAIFFGVIGAIVLALVIAIASIRSKAPAPRVVDVKAEAQRKRERALRLAANDAVKQGKLEDAHAKFTELKKVAPHSPFVASLLEKLDAIRSRNELGRQQLALATQKFNEGLALYNEKKYAEAIPLFEESFHINPSSDDTANYLKLAQQEQQRLAEEKSAAKKRAQIATAVSTATGSQQHPVPVPIPATNTRGPVGGDGGRGANNAPAQITTVFNSPFNDGYIMVKLGSQMVMREAIFEERGRLMFKRKYGRTVNSSKEVTPVNADLEVWIVVPSLSIQDHHVFPRMNFQPGSAHRLNVSADAKTKKFEYSIN